MKSLFAIALCLCLTASADVFIKNQGANIDRVDGGYKPMVSVNCGSNLVCSETRITDTGTADMLGTGHGTGSYTFGTIGSAQCVLQTTSVVSKGSEIGNFCLATSNHGADGGAALSADIDIKCRVTTSNTCKMIACNTTDDGGTITLADAGYSCLTLGF